MENIVRFLFEAGSLKLVPRSGWLKAGIKNPESVAEHSFRTALIAFILTYLETEDEAKAGRAAFLALLHDLQESRTLDLHRLSKKYVSVDKKAIREQLELLPEEIQNVIKTEELQKFVKDADRLELLLQAREYSESHPSVMAYVERLEFKTETAKKLAEVIRKTDPRWWLRLEG